MATLSRIANTRNGVASEDPLPGERRRPGRNGAAVDEEHEGVDGSTGSHVAGPTRDDDVLASGVRVDLASQSSALDLHGIRARLDLVTLQDELELRSL